MTNVLASWNEGQAKQAIIDFVASATQPGPGFVEPADYQPMRELVEMLRAHDFTVYVCSGGGRDFVRVVSEQMFGIPASM